jgi:hypothetical protein
VDAGGWGILMQSSGAKQWADDAAFFAVEHERAPLICPFSVSSQSLTEIFNLHE